MSPPDAGSVINNHLTVLEDVRRLVLAPNETLVVRLKGNPSHDTIQWIRAEMAAALPDAKILIHDDNVELSVVSQEPSDA